MIDILLPRQPGEIIYHFDVERNSIPLSQFVDTARASQDIIDNFNVVLFDKTLKYELHVRTPEEGGLVEVLTIIVGVPGSVLAFLATDIGKAFFRGLTMEEPAAWAEKFGATIRQRLTKATSTTAATKELVAIKQEEVLCDSVPQLQVDQLTVAEALAFILVRFLEADSNKLSSIGITPEKFRAAFQGRNRIFRACIDNPEVRGLAFDRSHDFPIKRRDFPRQITTLSDLPAEAPPETGEMAFETVDIVVNSPNWKRDGRNWQAATGKYQDVSFSIEDESFWLRVERRDPDLKPTIRDNMRVQWAYPAGSAKPAHVKVLRVLSYNGREISPSMSEQEIQALQSTIRMVEPDTPDLFDERRGMTNKNDEGEA